MFPGFGAGAPTFPLPSAFITTLLAHITDAGELKVTLFALWAIRQREGETRYLLERDFAEAQLFPGAPGALQPALLAAQARGTLLIELAGTPATRLIFVNDEAGRVAAAQARAGATAPLLGDQPVAILPPRPSIYRLYEQNIGLLTPMIRDELVAAEAEFPADWVEEAMRLAVANNKRSWRYIRAILDRWAKEGKSNETASRPAAGSEQRIARDPADFIIR